MNGPRQGVSRASRRFFRRRAQGFSRRRSRLRGAWFVSAAVLASGLIARAAHADGGYFAGQNGARAAGRAGAFAAKADDLNAMTLNPAGLADVDETYIQVANQLSYNAYAFTRQPTVDYSKLSDPPTVAFRTVQNQHPWQGLLPLLGGGSRLGLRNWSFALAAFAPSGVSREKYPTTVGSGSPYDAGQRYMMVEREAIMLSYAASAAWKPSELFGFGATFQWIQVQSLVYSMVLDGTVFEQELNPVKSNLDLLVTTRGSDPMTLNGILGAWVRPTPAFEIAVSGQVIPSKIVTHSTLELQQLSSNIGTMTIKRNGKPANDVLVTLPLPLVARLGARYRYLSEGRELFDVEADAEYQTWSRVSDFTVDANHLQVVYGGNSPVYIDQIKIPKRWKDTLTLRLGADAAVVPGRLTLRAGGFWASPVGPYEYTNIDFPTGPQYGGGGGASVFLGNVEVSLAYQVRAQPTTIVYESAGRVYQQRPGSPCTAPYTDSTTCNAHQNGMPGPVVNAGTYQAISHMLLLDLIYRFPR